MEEINFISVIDYIGKINDGVAILLSMKIIDKIYELVYWFNQDYEYLLSCDNTFLIDYNIKDIYEYKNYKNESEFEEENDELLIECISKQEL